MPNHPPGHCRIVLHLSIIVLTTNSVGASSKVYWPAGNDECKCIDIFNANEPLPGLVRGSNTPANPSERCALARGSDGFCFPSTYGSNGCSQHDLTASPECRQDGSTPAWCNDQWCYVDPLACKRGNVPSALFNDTYWGPERLAYSYETCGYVDSYSDTLLKDLRAVAARQVNGKLRISFPSDSGEGYALVGSKTYKDGTPKVLPLQGVGGTNRSGSVLVFMAKLLDESKVPWEEVQISPRSYAFSPSSSWTACVHEVALGNTDMCKRQSQLHPR
jgi:hypothetical protein